MSYDPPKPFFIDEFIVKVKTVTDQTYKIGVSSSTTVLQLKYKIESRIGLKPNEQALTFKGIAMQDSKKMSDYGVQAGDTIRLVMRGRGG
ncbi:uncharacterized protein LOC135691449 [Rhopilema esculentum]|uniref:uncharacterized protein LOC135691449 n=1 Tax=Rhopilema esculentum TaxID=499914 RepID=UPI0031DEDE2A